MDQARRRSPPTIANGRSGRSPKRGVACGAVRRTPRAAPVFARGFEDVRDFRGEEEAAALLRVRVDEPPEDAVLVLDVLRPLREAPRCDGEPDAMAWWSCEKARVSNVHGGSPPPGHRCVPNSTIAPRVNNRPQGEV